LVSNNGSAGVDGFVASGHNITGFYIPGGSNSLSYSDNGTQYASPALFTSNLHIDAVLDDGDSTGNAIIAVSQDGGDDVTRYFMTIPKSHFPGGAIAAADLANPPGRDKLERDSFGFADGSVFAFDRGSSRYVRIDPADASDQDSLYSTRPQDARFAYRVSGGEFYGFDTKSRVLTKYTAWW
jgi:hypothetical protein